MSLRLSSQLNHPKQKTEISQLTIRETFNYLRNLMPVTSKKLFDTSPPNKHLSELDSGGKFKMGIDL